MSVAKQSLLWIGLALLIAATAARAESPSTASSDPAPLTACPICRHANNQSAPYAEQAVGSLARGVTNVFFGWTEMIVRPTAEVERHGNLLIGIGQGLSHSVSRTAAGIGEALTFWMPKSSGGPSPLATDCPICMSVQHAKASKPSTGTSSTTSPH